MQFTRKYKVRRLVAIVTAALTLTAVSSCKNRGELEAQGGSQFLESRTPLPGETNGRLIMDSTTFTTDGAGWGRDGTEIEIVKAVAGLNAQELMAFADHKSNGQKRTQFERMAIPVGSNAFALGHNGSTADNISKIPWTKEASAMREANPYVHFMVEKDRLTHDATANTWTLNVGTDYNVDGYYDTPDFILLANDILTRARNRMDQPGEIRRVLIQSKISLGVGANGLKSAAKKDIRESGGQELLPLMDSSIKSGKNLLRNTPIETADQIEALKSVYFSLKEKNVLPTLDGKADVLMLIPQSYVFSVRARYHLNFASAAALKTLFELGVPLIEDAAAAVEASTAYDDAAKVRIRAATNGIKDRTIIAAAAKSELESAFANIAVDATTAGNLMNVESLTTKEAVRQALVVLQARDKLLKKHADELEALGPEWEVRRRQIRESGSAGLGVWFRKAANTFANARSSEWSNFLIDTFDYSKATTAGDFANFNTRQQQMRRDIPNEKVFFASIVNEVQIELGLEKPYTSCIRNSEAQPDNAELKADAEMCKFLLGKLTAAQDYIATARGHDVELAIRRAGLLRSQVKWVSGEASKGENVLRIARGLPNILP